ncbi:MAG: lipid A deacylase LpxR family protein [Planctomycetes bacterium]|nr:lipid A deacylase LpxR family protein [Planctomycetota bacterium]
MTRQIALCVVTVAALSAGALAQEPAPTEEAPAPAADPEELAPPAEDPASPPSEPAAAAPAETLSRFTVLSENDKFAGTDRFYTNGLKLIYQRDDVGRLSWGVSDLIGLIPFLQARPLTYGFVLGQNIYTPADTEQELLIPGDRPYGAWLYVGFSLTRGNRPDLKRRDPRALFEDRIVLNVGVIGTDAQGELVQNTWHRTINVSTSKGWHNQIQSEVGVQLYLQRKWLLPVWPSDGGLGADFLPHFGGAIGNVFTHASLGGTFRFGWNLGAEFGPSQRIASSGLGQPQRLDGLRAYVFGRIEGRGVVHNAFLDGNLFRGKIRKLSINGISEENNISSERFVADFELGVYLAYRVISLSFTMVTRTREFKEQGANFTFGAVHVSFTF